MREIKFRVWDKHQEKFICSWMDGLRFEMTTGQIYVNGTNFTDHYDIQQFTGLHDKNGVEIYEGDIVKGHMFSPPFGDDKEFVGVCEYQECAFVFSWKTKSGDETWCAPYETSHFEEPCLEVIGNIHENPELIED